MIIDVISDISIFCEKTRKSSIFYQMIDHARRIMADDCSQALASILILFRVQVSVLYQFDNITKAALKPLKYQQKVVKLFKAELP